jgi:hypothetical protein
MVVARLVVPERQAVLLYDSLLPRFSELAGMATIMLCATACSALVLYMWNNRQLPLPRVVQGRLSGQARRRITRLIAGALVPSPVARAGFFFTVQTLARSAQHRISIAGACAVAIAAAILLMHGVRAVGSPAGAPARFLALQTIVLAIVLVGVRHALAIPAELRANWTFSMAWNGDLHPFLVGVTRAVVTTLVLPTLAVMFGRHAYVLGVRAALQYGSVGFVLLVLVECLVRPEKLPLTCSARPAGHLKGAGADLPAAVVRHRL